MLIAAKAKQRNNMVDPAAPAESGLNEMKQRNIRQKIYRKKHMEKKLKEVRIYHKMNRI